jgi:P27 family predicted phage terminase small subunit
MTADAKKFWRKIAKDLHKVGLLTTVDATALEMLCESYATWRDAVSKIDEFGVLVKTPNGYPVQGPYLQIANKAQMQMLRLLAEFGLTPSSRTKIRGEVKAK